MPKKILVIRYRFIGDTILTIPFLRNLRKAYPDAQIDMLVAPKSGEVIENCPYVDNFIYFDTTRKHKYENVDSEKKTFFSYVKKFRKEKYNKAYVLKRSLSSALLAFFSGIKERIGFDTEGRGFLLTKKVKYNKLKHESECFLDVLKIDDINIEDTHLENWVSDEALAKVESVISRENVSNKKKVIVHATATNEGKLWPIENFAKVVEYLSNEKGVHVIYIGTDFDRETYQKLESLIDNELSIKPINLCGEFSLQESLAMISKSDLLVGNDSGNLHMAASVGTKVIGLYGPMPFEKWYALGENNILLKSDLDCMPCGLRKPCQRDKKCLRNITVDMVKDAINKTIN